MIPYEPNIIDIKKNIIINEIKSTMHPFFLLTSNDKILLNLSGMTNNIWKIKVINPKVIAMVKLLNLNALK